MSLSGRLITCPIEDAGPKGPKGRAFSHIATWGPSGPHGEWSTHTCPVRHTLVR
ncbi:hypothetical protein T484DRAFT_1974413, partial [Baffinella frigidus]